ncbi:sensor histidine kinase [Schumannella sp. 10F1B-5-1]|uniref:sensor histidine kinase n=1 Tax=Schumannella sp. 10F1B-5-1 TaxID=2590780 RepID=UPI001130B5FE|nr:ATP-binding protein [Schumannella sp. 10F1B-5-1]TPW73085.1 hypothetical protein FJ658_07535 [Schumannella sp. 10F1B-5-1]
MRVAVLPRDVASGVITDTITRMTWRVGAIYLLLDVPIVIEAYLRLGLGADMVVPLLLLAAHLGLVLVAMRWPSRRMAFAYLGVAAVLTATFQLTVLGDIPDAVDHYNFLLNRPAVALVLVATASTSPLIASAWLLAGLMASCTVTAFVAAIGHHPFEPGFGPTMMMIIGVGLYGVLAAIQHRARARIPNFDELEAETQAIATGADLSRRTTAVVHDTVLNDLAIVMNGSDQLDERTRARLRDDLDTLTSAEWLTTSHHVPTDESDAVLRNRIARVVTEYQWRGLTVHVSGANHGIYSVTPDAGDALIDATRAALENVLRHSHTSEAEIVVSATEDMTSIMVIDQGVGFDASAVAGDRLGLRESMAGRLERVGGRFDVWSTPGAGTSVVLTVPVVAVIAEAEPAQHRLIGQELPPEPDAERDIERDAASDRPSGRADDAR